MKISERGDLLSGMLPAGYDFEASARAHRNAVAAEQADEAVEKVEEAKAATTNTTFRMMDRHNEMVKKSQEAFEAKARKRAIERQNTERREEHSTLLAEMALRNAERQNMLEAARLRDQTA